MRCLPNFVKGAMIHMNISKLLKTGEGLDQIEDHFLNLDSEFRFKCRRCGKCCKHQNTILFNTRDIFNIALKLGMTMLEVIEAFTEPYIGRGSRIPIVHLIPNGPGESCPLLKDGRCSVHDCKPTVCALFPLGRVVSGKIPKQGLLPDEEMTVHYILNDIDCGSAKRVNTVRSWLAKFGIPEEDEYYLLWNKVIIEQGAMVRKLEEHKASPRLLNLFWSIQFGLLYTQYDTAQDFMPQFQRAAEKLTELSGIVKKAEEAAGGYEATLKMLGGIDHEA